MLRINRSSVAFRTSVSCRKSHRIVAHSVRQNQKLTPDHPCPDPDEEREVAHEALVNALERCKPPALRIKGMQQFASAIWERRRRIPSQLYRDPLERLFEEFDVDNDGHLTAAEVTKALSSHGVEVTEKQVQQFIDAADSDANQTIERSEFRDFIFRMAVADLRGNVHPSKESIDEAMRSDL